MDAAAAAPSALRAVTLLRQHSHLLSLEGADQFQSLVLEQLNKARPHSSPRAVRLLLCLVMVGKLLNDPERAATYQILWGGYCRNEGRYRHALRRLARAEEIGNAIKNPFLQISSLAGRASLYELLGNNARAADAYLKALNLARESGNEYLTPPTVIKLAGCYRGMHRYSDALQLVDSALSSSTLLAVAPDIHDEHVLQCRMLRGLLLEDLGRYDEGLGEYQQAAKIAEAYGNRPKQFMALNNIAASHMKVGDHREALRSYNNVLKIVEGWGNLVMAAATHNNIGTVLLQLGRPADARRHFGKALSVKLAVQDKQGEVTAYLGLAKCARQLGEKETAKTFYTLCLIPVFETHSIELITLYASHALSDPEDTGEESLSLVEWAQQQAQERGKTVYDLMLSSVIGGWHVRHERIEKAIAIYRDAIARGRSADPDSPIVLRLQIDLAGLLSSQAKTRQEAYDLLSGMVAHIETQLRQVLVDRRRSEIVGEWFRLFGALIRLLVSHGDELRLPDGSADPLTVAFNLHESAKARGFTSSLASATLSVPQTVPEGLRDEEERLLRLEREYQASNARETIEFETARLQRLREIAAELEACWRKIEPYAPEYVMLRRGEAARLEDVQEIFSKDAGALPKAFVSCFSDDEGVTWFVQRSDRADVGVFRAAVSRSALLETAKRLRRAFNGAPVEFPPYPPVRRTQPWDRDLRFFETLGDELLTFLPGVAGIEHICVAPHGPLHLLPIHALRAPDGRYLAEHFAITYAPNLGSLRYCIARRGNESTRADNISVLCAGVASRDDVRLELFERDQEIFELGDWQKLVVHSGTEASRAAVLRELSQHTLIQLTCHGFFDEADPLNSGLLFSDGLERPPQNPRGVSIFSRNHFVLTTRDILRTPMRAQLVTLRACSTGLQVERNTGDEFEGLSRAILCAGNAATLVSLWNVDQESSKRFLACFYRHWTDREAPKEKWRALWMAQKQFLSETADPFLRHPYHWAPLVLIGDWR